MRLVTYQQEGLTRVGAVRIGAAGQFEVVDLAPLGGARQLTVRGILAQEPGERSAMAAKIESADATAISEVRLLAPVVDPQKIICVGLNYADHAAETGATTGDEPVIFCKFPTAICGPDASIELPPESTQVDFEAELVVVIGKRARRVPRADAWRHIGGYACGHDVSARDWQKNKPGKQWLLGKSFDGFAPLGPWLVTPEEVADPGNLPIELCLNGIVMQQSTTSQLIFPIDYLVSYLSQVCTLLPGDLIYTGTPPGVGMARKPPVFLKPGDVTEVAIEGLGLLRNIFVAPEAAPA